MEAENQVTNINALLADVEESEKGASEADQAEIEARRRKSAALNRSKDAWNALYDHLLVIAKKSKRSDGFQSSKFGTLFKDI